MFFCTVILTELSMFCVRLSHFIIKFDLILIISHRPPMSHHSVWGSYNRQLTHSTDVTEACPAVTLWGKTMAAEMFQTTVVHSKVYQQTSQVVSRIKPMLKLRRVLSDRCFGLLFVHHFILVPVGWISVVLFFVDKWTGERVHDTEGFRILTT